MQTQPVVGHGTAPPVGVGERELVLALGIVLERILRLPKEDKEDLFQLLKELMSAKTADEFEASKLAIEEILDQRPVSAIAPDDPSETSVPEKARKWLEFVSTRLRELRVKKGMSQEQLAAVSGLPQSHISRLEGGKHSPSRKTLERLADALGVAVSEFDPSA